MPGGPSPARGRPAVREAPRRRTAAREARGANGGRCSTGSRSGPLSAYGGRCGTPEPWTSFPTVCEDPGPQRPPGRLDSATAAAGGATRLPAGPECGPVRSGPVRTGADRSGPGRCGPVRSCGAEVASPRGALGGRNGERGPPAPDFGVRRRPPAVRRRLRLRLRRRHGNSTACPACAPPAPGRTRSHCRTLAVLWLCLYRARRIDSGSGPPTDSPESALRPCSSMGTVP